MGTFTMATGFGMLAVGLIVIGAIATGFLFITRMIERDRQQEDERKQWETKYGSK